MDTKNTPEKLEKLGDYEFDCGNWQQAYDYYRQVVELDVDRAYSWFRRSICAMKLDKTTEFINGIERARSLATPELLNVIEEQYYSEMVDLYFNAIDSNYESSRGYGPQHDVEMFTNSKDAIKHLKSLINLSNEVKVKLSIGDISAETAMKIGHHIYNTTYKVIEFDPDRYKPAQAVWIGGVALDVIPEFNNLAAWINYHIQQHNITGVSRKPGIKAKFI